MNHISAPEFLQEIQNASEKFYILDVRTEVEYKKKKLAGVASDNVPLDEVPDVLDTIVNHCRDMRTYILCKAGKRAEFAAADLEAAGAQNVVVIDGGTMALEALEAPFETGILNIERQYYILMGGMVMAGFFPYLWLLPVFAGVSLLFRGITGQCGIVEMVRRLPWNTYLSQDIQEEISKSVGTYQQKKTA